MRVDRSSARPDEPGAHVSDAIGTGGHGSKSLTVGERLDRLPVSRLHAAILILCALGLLADIAEVALSNVLAAVFLAPPYGMARSDLSLLLASVFAGGAVGAPVLGWLADRYGRRSVLQGALGLIAASSLAAAASRDVAALTACRFVSGLAIGAYPPLTAAYLSDVLPPARRGALMMACAALAFLGAPAVILLLRALQPAALGVEAWRWALAAGGLTAALTAALFARLPDSPRWLAALGRADEAERECRRFERSAGLDSPRAAAAAPPALGPRRAAFGALVADGRQLRRAALLAALYCLGPWATLGFPLLSAAVMVTKGFAVGDSILFAGLSMMGPTVGILAVAAVIDRFDRRLALIACAAVMALLGLGFAAATGLTALVLLGIGFNLASAVYSAVLSLYGAEMFPTGSRASATAGAWGLGRVVSIFVPLALLPLLTSHGPMAMFAVITAALVASLVLILSAGPPGRASRSLD